MRPILQITVRIYNRYIVGAILKNKYSPIYIFISNFILSIKNIQYKFYSLFQSFFIKTSLKYDNHFLHCVKYNDPIPKQSI